ncbi:hypothetical protein CBW65_06625 [Tumebacillus avium]|uniref:Uncharacterized protein n=1 Tax=Tumebacillus avium TaxID=1903704 RepID=A0A1Y0IJX3_9BACL|nr:hypothetical protein [Tumebacillus avium]ARU60802.1 hypothetical protein CBW65_06625 [Tumebacillus avium]
MAGFPPEKYYEACITHHLVNEFKERYNKRLYPFSISQIEESSKGFDFGYVLSGRSFYIQYKRPFAYVATQSLYSWQICRNQLSVINSQQHVLRTYYALPAFVGTGQWFEGLDHTYFVTASKLAGYLERHREKTKTSIIHSNLKMLKPWSHFSSQFVSPPRNAIAQSEQKDISFEEIIRYTETLDPETRECTWVYLLEERS